MTHILAPTWVLTRNESALACTEPPDGILIIQSQRRSSAGHSRAASQNGQLGGVAYARMPPLRQEATYGSS
jgi:hypothetical protein